MEEPASFTSTHWWTFALHPACHHYNQFCINITTAQSLRPATVISPGQFQEVELQDFKGSYNFKTFGTWYQTVLQKGGTKFLCHQQGTRVMASPHHHRHWLLSILPIYKQLFLSKGISFICLIQLGTPGGQGREVVPSSPCSSRA